MRPPATLACALVRSAERDEYNQLFMAINSSWLRTLTAVSHTERRRRGTHVLHCKYSKDPVEHHLSIQAWAFFRTLLLWEDNQTTRKQRSLQVSSFLSYMGIVFCRHLNVWTFKNYLHTVGWTFFNEIVTLKGLFTQWSLFCSLRNGPLLRLCHSTRMSIWKNEFCVSDTD